VHGDAVLQRQLGVPPGGGQLDQHPSAPRVHGRVEISVPEPMPALHALTEWAMARGLPLADISVQRPSLEDIYLRLTAGDAHRA